MRRRNLRKLFLISLVLLFTSAFLYAEEPVILTVDTAADIAVGNNLTLQSADIDLKTAQREKNNRWNNFLPSLNAQMGLNYADQLFTDAPPQVIPFSLLNPAFDDISLSAKPWTFNMGLQATLNLNMATFTSIRKTGLDYEAGLLTYEQARQQLVRDTKKSFYSLITMKDNIRIMENNIAIAEKRYQQAQANYNNGLIPEVELLRIQVTVEKLKPAYSQMITAYENSLMMFKFLLGMDRNTEIVLEGDLETAVYDFDAEQLIDRYLANRLDIKILTKSIQSLEETRKGTAYQMMTPTLSLSSSYGTGVNDAFNKDAWEKGSLQDQFTFGIALTMPLDTLIPGSKGNTTLKTMDDNIDKLNNNLHMLFESAAIEVTNLVNQLDNTKANLNVNKLNLNLATKSYKLTEEAYRLGTKEILDVETAQADLFQAEQDLLTVKYNYILGLLDLEYALSTPVEVLTEE